MSAKSNSPRRGAARVSRHGKDGPQIVEITGHRWTEDAEAKFIDTLSASCNVRLAAAAAGFSTEAIYRRRRNDPGFAERWHAALAQGYARIEMALVARAADTMEGIAPDSDSPIPTMTVGEMIAILKLHRSSVTGEGNHPGWRARPRSLAEVRASILTKFEAIEVARRALPPPVADET